LVELSDAIAIAASAAAEVGFVRVFSMFAHRVVTAYGRNTKGRVVLII